MTPLDAAQVIYDLIAADPTVPHSGPSGDLTGIVDRVYFIEPDPGKMSGPIAVSVIVSGLAPLEFNTSVIVYGMIGQEDAVTIQRQVIDAAAAIDTLLDQTSIYARSQWTNDFELSINSFVARTDLIASRTDF